MNEFFKGKNIRFAIAAILYILVVIWIGNYLLLLGLVVIFDLYITEKVNWTFWKKRHGKNSAFIEWLDALIEYIEGNINYVTGFCRELIPEIIPGQCAIHMVGDEGVKIIPCFDKFNKGRPIDLSYV